MKNKQHGMGMLAWLFALCSLAIFVFTGIKVVPLYGEKLIVLAAMQTVATMPDTGLMSKKQIRTYFRRNIEISSSYKRFSNEKSLKKLVKVTKKTRKGKRYLRVAYEGRKLFYKDLYFTLPFDHKVELGRTDSG